MEASTWIDADPERVWSLVCDVELMPTLSNELQAVEWVDGPPGPGSAPGSSVTTSTTRSVNGAPRHKLSAAMSHTNSLGR
ncbi:polyketide cyclase / dehydrase and lipid transport family protein [Mycobacterium kansasii]|uniref:Polyketide cyclase / dehydrase and lipid transport family protein n=1 Tax=Mycobacterium kansasii TaxID=1768 RepID=A0A1V3WC83_MYCKA|nr:polyketide cyclase / dehydrase and lipid transport family protein [Mycobacterium kansasii]